MCSEVSNSSGLSSRLNPSFGQARPLALAAAAPMRTGGKTTHPAKAIMAGKYVRYVFIFIVYRCTCMETFGSLDKERFVVYFLIL